MTRVLDAGSAADAADVARSAPRAASVYIAAPGGGTGKSTVALGVLRLLAATVPKVGVFRPIPRSTEERDYVLELMLEHATAGLAYDRCLGLSYDRVHEDPEAALAEIVSIYHDMARDCDAVVVVGSDYTDVVTPSGLAYDGRVAANLAAPVLLVLSGRDRVPAKIAAMAQLCLRELRGAHAYPIATIVNRSDPAGLSDVGAALAGTGLSAWVLPEDPVLAAPTMSELLAAVQGTLVSGDPALLHREALSVMVGGMTAEHALERLSDGVVVIVPADRSDYILAMVTAHAAAGFPSLAGLILNGGLKPHPTIAALLDALKPTLPIITTELHTYPTAEAVTKTRARVSGESLRKVDTALALTERYLDGPVLLEHLRVQMPDIVTPQMFEYALLSRARKHRKHIVLPEGEDDRTLRAAGRLLQREIVELTLLGDAATIGKRAAELGMDISTATVIDPLHSELREQFSHEYARLRAHRGMTEDRAFEIVGDGSYFATMMVQLRLADGMVSGALHTTAHTIRPAFEIVKTEPGISTVSSTTFMCLADRVLAFSDVAVIPNPTPEELADIAISSAKTAAQFGLEPRVAMLSYSTGASGQGADVDAVRAATELVRARRPDLLIEGPIQYDAAIVPSVAATKLPDSPVAGRATVLVFPDLNTGNSTVKAVQRNAHALMVGPILQGLRKPVNDLSRGALVDDIVNTIAATAIQAQQMSEEPAS